MARHAGGDLWQAHELPEIDCALAAENLMLAAAG